MKGTIKTLLLSTSVAVGMSAIAAGSAVAASLSNVQMFGSDYAVYGAPDAASALTDGDRYSNVELNVADEILSNNVTGFTGNLGVDSVKVEGINQADWDGGLGTKWMADFSAAYPALATASLAFNNISINLGAAIMSTASAVVGRSGDPNVAYMAKNDATGAIEMDLIGHYNIWNSPWLQTAINSQVNALATQYRLSSTNKSILASAVNNKVTQLKTENPLLQVSEIAKVTINGQSQFAYNFSATKTGLSIDDGSSHSGRYTIALQGTAEPPESEDVPEPSLMLGLAAISGLVATSKRKSQQA